MARRTAPAPARVPLDDEPAVAHAIEVWFARVGRDLPWRRTRDPYAIWVSEVMLQQTQVATVIDYYARFLARFPTIAALAAAPIADALKCWEGLGYYARCRNLHAAAGECVASHGGQFPMTLEHAMALPGIGRSTAGAILCFSRGEAHPLLDANAKRVLARLYQIDGDTTKRPVLDAMWECSSALVERARDPWAFNQGLMELGATVCAVRAPDCARCPVAAACRARVAGVAAELPRRRVKKLVPHKEVAIGIVRDQAGRVLVQLRPPEGLLGGLWEFPGGKREDGETFEVALAREMMEELGIEIEIQERLVVVDHAYSHFTVELHAYVCRLVAGVPEAKVARELRWVREEELDGLAFPRANRKIVQALCAPLPPLWAP